MRLWAALAFSLAGTGSVFGQTAGYDRIIAFGDSLSDNGNIYNITKGTPIQQPPAVPPYFGGRFSNGPTWIELLSNPAKSSNSDSSMNRFWGNGVFGFFGPLTTTGNVNAALGGAQAAGGLIPSVQTQIGAYQLAGGKFGSNNLVSVQGGANDFFNAPASADANAVAKAEAGNIAAVINAGARTVLVSNIPDIGLTPAYNGVAAATNYSVTYNAELNQQTQVLAAANPGANLVQVDWFSALKLAIANPAAFGFTDVTTPCYNAATKAPCAPTVAEQNTHLFWDGVHPTGAGHALLAAYASQLLATGETGKAISPLGQAALSARLDAGDILFRRGFLSPDEHPSGIYAEIIGQTGTDQSAQPFSAKTDFDYSLSGVRAGFDGHEGNLQLGAAVAYQDGDVKSKLLRSDLTTTQVDAYALTRFDRFFAGVEGGVSFNDYSKIVRNTGFPTVQGSGSTSGIDYTVAGTAGTVFNAGAIDITPAFRIGYASVNVGGFTEDAPLLALQYGSRDISSGFWTARVRASAALPSQIARAIIYGEVGYEDLFSTDDSYSAKLAFNTAHAVTFSGTDLEARGVFLKAGIGGTVFNKIDVSGEYGISLQNDGGEVHSGRLRLTVPLDSRDALER